MPYDVQNGDVLEVTIQGRLDGQRMLHVLHYELNDLAAPTDGIALIDDFNAVFNVAGPGSYTGDFAKSVAIPYAFDAIVYQWIFATRRARIIYVPENVAGTMVGHPSPPNVALAITRRTELPGAAGHGTIHVGGMVDENLEGGYIDPASLSLFDDLRDWQFEVIAPGGGANLYPLVFNKLNPALFNRIVSAETKQTVRTMHRRTVGVGE